MLNSLLILIVIGSALLVLFILAQDPRGGLNKMAVGATQALGIRKAADLLEKYIWYLGLGILSLVAVTYFILAI